MPDLKNALPGRRRVSRLVKFGFRICGLFALLTYGFNDLSWAGPELVSGQAPKAPPQPPPIEHMSPQQITPGRKPLGITPYSIGQPTDEEQLYLEYLNRMRANPTAEGQRLATTIDPNVVSAYGDFSVDLSLMQSEFATNPPVAPLAMNAQLTSAARWHSGDMFTNQYQGHFQTMGTLSLSPGDRIKTNGYNASIYGENVFSYATSVFQGHAAFAVDWGNAPGGMQTPPGHRENMLFSNFREVGIGVVDGLNGTVGPQLVTQDFGTQFSATPLITGVVYFDLNGNGFYDIGEGIGGVTVNTPGSTFFTTTADSGGYALPVPGNGNYPITFTASGLSNQIVANVSGLLNAKIDYSPTYTPPVISGPNPAALNQNNSYNFSGVAGATAYQWQQAQLSPYTQVEGAENGLSNVTVSVSPGYSVVSADFAAAGTHSFKLAHSDPVDQNIQLNALLLLGTNSSLNFAGRLGFSLSNEVAEAQISIDGGTTWQTVWSEPGNDGTSPVDSSFVNRSIPLNAYAGQLAQLRFVYAYSGGLHFGAEAQVGLYLDSISLSDAQQLSGIVISAVASGTSFNFAPAIATNYLLAVHAKINSRILPWGQVFTVSAATGTPAPGIEVLSTPVISGSQVQIDFTVSNFHSGMTFQLFHSGDLTGGWTQDASATPQTLIANSKFRFITSTTGGPSQFFKVRAN
jgi:hypothetical protein